MWKSPLAKWLWSHISSPRSSNGGFMMLRILGIATLFVTALMIFRAEPSAAGVRTANGWYEGEEIYYVLLGGDEGVTERGDNDLYLIGNDRAYQANVVEHIPGEPGYSPHWNVNLVHTAPGVTLGDILASPYVSEHFDEEGVLFDDVEDILGAEAAGLITIDHPGVVVLCPIISEQGAEAPGHIELSEDFPPFPDTF